MCIDKTVFDVVNLKDSDIVNQQGLDYELLILSHNNHNS